MSTPDINELRYPVGRFSFKDDMTPEKRNNCILEIESAPAKLREAVKGLMDKQLDTPYRPEGWTVRQVVHHIPDSHINAYVRMKLALTEVEPTICVYEEKEWAKLVDTFQTPVEVSLNLLESLHKRWIVLLKSLTEEDCKRKFIHPESGLKTIDWLIALYSWHGKHHTTHITSLRERMKW
jgi:DinB superfamily